MPMLVHVAATVAVASAVAAAASTNGVCTNFTDTDFDGHDLHAVHADGAGACCDACDSTAGCVVWTFMPPHTCYMKTSSAGKRAMHGYTSGCKGDNCTLPPTPPPPPHGNGYGCDPFGGERGVCVIGYGNFSDSSCGGTCSNASAAATFKCESDWDCSLAGTCGRDGHCSCDPWTSGVDCSYLRFQPVDRATTVGYLDPTWSSWGGNAVKGSDDQWHLFMAEIGPAGRKGLGGWGSHSQVAHAVSQHPEGPYTRKALVEGPEHHNPTLKVSPVDGSWNMYSISATSGPIQVTTSHDEGATWTHDTKVSDYQNPGPLLWKNGSMTMWYRDSASTSSPCSSESIGVQYCTNATAACAGGRNPVYTHTSEDPSVFVDKRGNFHMLINALPGGCKPKVQQGGHAWSRDGIVWSEPRVGAYNTTIQFADGTNMTCERRERPQIVQDPASGDPLVMFSGVTGCPRMAEYPAFQGGGDCFTLAQLLARD